VPTGLQAALREVVAVGVTPRELAMMALSCLTSWAATGGQHQTALTPQHLQTAIRGSMSQHDSRVSECGAWLAPALVGADIDAAAAAWARASSNCVLWCAQVLALVGLSVLELCMLVAAQRLEDAGNSIFNFQVSVVAWLRAGLFARPGKLCCLSPPLALCLSSCCRC
jgi:hypothetical protein